MYNFELITSVIESTWIGCLSEIGIHCWMKGKAIKKYYVN